MDKNQVLEFIKSQTLAVLSTASPTGKAESAVMAIAVTDTWDILMSTESNTRKVINLKTNPFTSVLVGGVASPSVQLDGITTIYSGSDAKPIKQQIIAIHPDTAPYLTPTSVYIKFTPTWYRYSDFRVDPPVIEESRL
jgi:general stress protein 26